MNEGYKAEANAIAEYIESQAEWRERKAEEYPNDSRNAKAAAALWSLAEYVRGLPADDERIADVARMRTAFNGDIFSLGSSGSQEVGRYGFDGEVDHEAFLNDLPRLVRDDLLEVAEWGGVLDEESN